MKRIAVTQRVAVDPRHGERRDCLDQRWIHFMLACGLTPVPVPNDATAATRLFEQASLDGVVLTGGNDLAAYGGDAPERDAMETALIDQAERAGRPVLGVCRGMQVIQHRFGVPLRRVEGHVATRQVIRIEDVPTDVNSFHNFGTTETRAPLDVWAVADDRIVKAVRHPGARMLGVMWHPERLDPFAGRDIAMFRTFFGVSA
jgi:putative glutamine amidotransferase